MSTFKLGPRQTKWIESLRSGKYTKGTERLHHDDKYCCLGVACAVFKDELNLIEGETEDGTHYNGETAMPPASITKHLRLYGRSGGADSVKFKTLARVNDETYRGDTNFNNIADYIEKHAEHYFTESV